jgi:hypothetical protein
LAVMDFLESQELLNAGLVRCLDVQHCNHHDHDHDRQIDHNYSTRTSRKFSFSLAFESIIVRAEARLGLMIAEERLQLATRSGSVPRLKMEDLLAPHEAGQSLASRLLSASLSISLH